MGRFSHHMSPIEQAAQAIVDGTVIVAGGRATGQTVAGGTAAGEALNLTSTSNTTKGLVTVGSLFNVNETTGEVTTTGFNLSALNTAPATAGAAGVLGDIRVTATAIYVCTATNTWVKAALATW